MTSFDSRLCSLSPSHGGCNLINDKTSLRTGLLPLLPPLLLGLTDPVPGDLPPQPLLLPETGVEEGGVGVGELPVGLTQLEVPVHVAGPAQVPVHLAPVVHGDLRVVGHGGPLGEVGGMGGGGREGWEAVEDSLVLLDVDEAEDAGGEEYGEYGEPVAGLAVARVDVA